MDFERHFSPSSFLGMPALDLKDLSGHIRAVLTLKADVSNPQGIVRGALSKEGNVISPIQVHGKNIVTSESISKYRDKIDADGIIVTEKKTTGTLQFADCLPVFMVSTTDRSWAMMLHSGFKGTVHNIVDAGWKKLLEVRDISPKELEVWIGPGIGRCCYQRRIDDEWTKNAMNCLSDKTYSEKGDYVYFDLLSAIKEQILSIGVSLDRVHTNSLCTSCNNKTFYSYRKGDLSDRMVLVASIDGF